MRRKQTLMTESSGAEAKRVKHQVKRGEGVMKHKRKARIHVKKQIKNIWP